MDEWRGNEWPLTHPTHSILDDAPDGCFGAIVLKKAALAEV